MQRNCPECKGILLKSRKSGIPCWVCKSCNGAIVQWHSFERAMSVLSPELLTQFRSVIQKEPPPGKLCCPFCKDASKPMTRLPIKDKQGKTHLIGHCGRCECLWISKPKPGSTGVLEKIEAQHLFEDTDPLIRTPQGPDSSEDPIASFFSDLSIFSHLSFLNQIPIVVQIDEPSLKEGRVEPKHETRLSLTVLFLIIISSAAAHHDLEGLGQRMQYLPEHPFRYLGTNLLTYAFVHQDLPHLFANLYFFYLFSVPIEQDMGSEYFLKFLFLVTVSTALGHGFFLNSPILGANGMIAGMMAYFLCAYPRARLKFKIYFLRFNFDWIQFPAWLWILGWAILQYYFYEAQLGGALAGFLYFFWRRNQARQNLGTN